MEFNPVEIRNISDVLPHIDGKPEIIRIYKENYTVIDYVYSSSTTFDNPYAKECRGLKFDAKTGEIIARPYHKFHNLGENPEYATDKVDLSLPHNRLDKLDGSMVHTVMIDGELRLMTRKGESEVALAAMKWLDSKPTIKNNLIKAIEISMRSPNPCTFIFEYVGPNNRIVIPYENEELILTAIRVIYRGKYTPYALVKIMAEGIGLNVVKTYDRPDVASDDEKEGCIIRFDTGAMIKIKSDIYVRKHRSKDLVTKFKDLVDLIINENLDDCLPSLDDETKVKVCNYRDELTSELYKWGDCLLTIVDNRAAMTQKDFALGIKSSFADAPFLHPLIFATRKSGSGLGEMKRCIQRACSDTTRLTKVFEELELPVWTGDFFSE